MQLNIISNLAFIICKCAHGSYCKRYCALYVGYLLMYSTFISCVFFSFARNFFSHVTIGEESWKRGWTFSTRPFLALTHG